MKTITAGGIPIAKIEKEKADGNKNTDKEETKARTQSLGTEQHSLS